MLLLISPAKKLDFSPYKDTAYTQPRLLNNASQLISELQHKSASEIGQLMHLSQNLSNLNYQRYQVFNHDHNLQNAKQALFTFAGDVYSALDANSLTAKHIEYAQQHLRILSGLYGLLRPLDLIQAHRLEMGTKLPVAQHNNLYSFWEHDLTNLLTQDINASHAECVINLASQEYAKVLVTQKITPPLVNIHFKQLKNGQLKNIGLLTKKARGHMARFIITNQLTKHQDIVNFDTDNYVFQSDLSDATNYVFHQRA